MGELIVLPYLWSVSVQRGQGAGDGDRSEVDVVSSAWVMEPSWTLAEDRAMDGVRQGGAMLRRGMRDVISPAAGKPGDMGGHQLGCWSQKSSGEGLI